MTVPARFAGDAAWAERTSSLPTPLSELAARTEFRARRPALGVACSALILLGGCADQFQPTTAPSRTSPSSPGSTRSPAPGKAPATTSPTATPPATPDLVVLTGTITFTGMGKAQLGMSVADLAWAFGAGMDYQPMEPCPWIRPDVLGFDMRADREGRATSFSVHAEDDASKVSPQSPGVFKPTTAEGIGLGSRRDEVLAVYGSRVQPRRRVEPESTPSGLDPEDLVMTSGPGNDDYVVSFDIRDGVVWMIAVEPFWMTYGEPCV